MLASHYPRFATPRQCTSPTLPASSTSPMRYLNLADLAGHDIVSYLLDPADTQFPPRTYPPVKGYAKNDADNNEWWGSDGTRMLGGPPKPLPPQDAQIFVHTIPGKTITLNVILDENKLYDVMWAIHDLAWLITDNMGVIPVDTQRLAFKAWPHLNEKWCLPLSSHKIEHNSELNLVVVSKGDEAGRDPLFDARIGLWIRDAQGHCDGQAASVRRMYRGLDPGCPRTSRASSSVSSRP